MSENGLGRFCRQHLEHYRRHGDPLKSSYKAATIQPYRAWADRWFNRNPTDDRVLVAIACLKRMMVIAGPPVPPNNLRGLAAELKAKSVWARLRERGIEADELLVTILGVSLCYQDDPQKGKPEYRRVQIAKALNRMAGGKVKRWATHTTDPTLPTERVLRWFPASEGLVLRVLGEEAELATGFTVGDGLEDLLTLYRDGLTR